MIFGAILLHLGIALNMGLVVFSLFMYTLLLAWMPPAAIGGVRPAAGPIAAVGSAVQRRGPRQQRAAAVVYAADVWDQARLTAEPGREAGGGGRRRRSGDRLNRRVPAGPRLGPDAIGIVAAVPADAAA